ncbi:MAG: hypothetical protein UV05_C0053G0005 [candidate division CPR1 bacterium GW2011_GWA2_42_17]|uniref:Uncharacterized protein n=1 Tax=candidate division CPR1 bacterium GW2011_GWA2_42_17 TaxID=1618341 RepID=A0A0G0YYB2_9BACT|nr:MAG: hypothetical protein UV05_C0053G0005 [candidate division CPR1 bacterium GW2011_GWA2_42_17]
MYKHERVVIGAIIIGGLVALLFAFPYLGKAIRDPLKLQTRTVETLDEKEAREFKDLKGKDTDADTLTDYDEIYVWNTSAYLAVMRQVEIWVRRLICIHQQHKTQFLETALVWVEFCHPCHQTKFENF